MTGADSPDDVDDVDDLDDLYDLGFDLAEAGDHDRAVEVFRRAVLLGCAVAWLGLGSSLVELRRWEEAVEAFEGAAEAGEEDAWLDLAFVQLQLGRWVEAEQAALHALDGGDTRAWGPLGSALLAQGARPAAMIAFGQAAELGVQGGIEGARLLREAGREEEAEAWAQRAAAAGDPAAAALLVAWTWQATRDAGLELDLQVHADQHASARVCLADLLRSSDRVEEACAVLEAGALRGEVDSWLPLGNLYLEEFRDEVAAEAAYRGGIEGGDLFSHTNLGALLRDRGEETEAVEHLTIAADGGDELAVQLLRELRDPG
ncbi:MAG TPA: tetratricopeptide repeat protein [Modestobacter sp.]|nr:tetratricopeptide repeat protein [Modestobacter sp.]